MPIKPLKITPAPIDSDQKHSNKTLHSERMKPLHPIKLAATFGVLIGCIHLGWAALVAAGWAQPLINFVLWLHFIAPVYVIQPFDWRIALGLVCFASFSAFLAAFFFAYLWNRLHVE